MIDGLVRYSRVSGDFPWGVAAHPYPENLMDARTWEDTEPTNAFDTPKITPRNIEVLDRYMHQPALLYRGERVRTVLLSEQGFHTPPDYSQAALDDQASAIAYTWEKILPLASIETYHYHRWLDNAGEGGFLPGLRTLPTPEEPAGRRKQPGFDLFSALETERHTEAVRPHLERIGIPDPVAHSAPER